MPTTTTPAVDEGAAFLPKAPTLWWALKRALLAILILFFFISSVAWLLYASIDTEPTDVPAATWPDDAAPTTPAMLRRPASSDPKKRV
jgi:hypothetical protein